MRTFAKLFLAGMLIIMFSSLNAQHNRGNRVHVPSQVYQVTHHYPGYRWVAVDHRRHPRRPVYDVTLRRGRNILELRINRFGQVLSKKTYRVSHQRRNVKVTEYWSYSRPIAGMDRYRSRNRTAHNQYHIQPPSERYNYRRN